ncbi:d79e4e32-b6be-42ed-aa4d-ad9950a1dc32 [Thermothielavioides terrestris]|uniref:D79e4e32-b6be-42ed-aa4d-ad9950a1dc32 n=1 Tax=Thermothielavioides terrestris TaxID=2587410 RepID=A0A3S4D9Z7_9PEZI|nr:d79e4e32-b6be-42ed-aa4d-ad9950a1dc32 [Thermothielavioides terrestris]
MHYIRFCRPPEIQAGRSQASVKIVLTITTDLSDAFLSPRNPVPLAVIGAYTERGPGGDGADRLIPVALTAAGSPPTWRAGMRVLKLDLPLPPLPRPLETLQIRPLSRQLAALATSDVLPGDRGLIMPVYADIPREPGAVSPSVCFRSLRLSAGDGGGGAGAGGGAAAAVPPLQIEEDLGESIARHIWDSGVVMVSMLADLCLVGSPAGGGGPLPRFSSILLQQLHRPLNILELGCGVGVLGIGLARILSLSQQAEAGAKEPPHILMTDLPEAEGKARANIARQAGSFAVAPADLDFEPLDWQDGQNGQFGGKARSRGWDLVVLCDCTYNTDTLPPLVKTLSALHDHTARLGSAAAEAPAKTEVLVATKPRHSSERIFFDLIISSLLASASGRRTAAPSTATASARGFVTKVVPAEPTPPSRRRLEVVEE